MHAVTTMDVSKFEKQLSEVFYQKQLLLKNYQNSQGSFFQEAGPTPFSQKSSWRPLLKFQLFSRYGNIYRTHNLEVDGAKEQELEQLTGSLSIVDECGLTFPHILYRF